MEEQVVIEVELGKWTNPSPLDGSQVQVTCSGHKGDGVWIRVRSHSRGLEHAWNLPGAILADVPDGLPPSDLQEAMEECVENVIKQVKGQTGDDLDEGFPAALDSVVSNYDSEIMKPVLDEVCRRLGRESPW